MQEIKREVLVQKASEMLASGTVDRVLGWKVGEFDYDVTPAVFTSADELEKDFVWGDFCGANFSKYLIKETEKSESKVLVFLKPCDTYSFNQLLTEHRFDREKAYAVGIPCSGMLDINKIRNLADGISSIETLTVMRLTYTLSMTALLKQQKIPHSSRDVRAVSQKSTLRTTSLSVMTAR